MIGKDQPESTRICMKHQLFDPWWSAWICKESLTQKAKCHSRGGAKPLLPPLIMSHSAWLKLCDFAGCYSTYCRLSSFVVSCHVKDLASGVDIVASFNKECKQGEKVRRGYILYCCVNIKNKKGLNPGVAYLNGIWSARWNESWYWLMFQHPKQKLFSAINCQQWFIDETFLEFVYN